MTLEDFELPKLDPREVNFRIPGPRPTLKLFLRCLPALNPFGCRAPGLFFTLHGATLPIRELDSPSPRWRFMARCFERMQGFDVWALDFHGFGYSDRYEEMESPSRGAFTAL